MMYTVEETINILQITLKQLSTAIRRKRLLPSLILNKGWQVRFTKININRYREGNNPYITKNSYLPVSTLCRMYNISKSTVFRAINNNNLTHVSILVGTDVFALSTPVWFEDFMVGLSTLSVPDIQLKLRYMSVDVDTLHRKRLVGFSRRIPPTKPIPAE